MRLGFDLGSKHNIERQDECAEKPRAVETAEKEVDFESCKKPIESMGENGAEVKGSEPEEQTPDFESCRKPVEKIEEKPSQEVMEEKAFREAFEEKISGEETAEKPLEEMVEEKITEQLEDRKVSNEAEEENLFEETAEGEGESEEDFCEDTECSADELRDEQKRLEQRLGYKFEEILVMNRGTEEYAQALQEYNEIKDLKASIDARVEELDRYSAETVGEFETEAGFEIEPEAEVEKTESQNERLREEQIAEGERAANIAAATILGAEVVEQRFEDTYHSDKKDEKAWVEQQESSEELMEELIGEKLKLQIAMDAKQQEMKEYVYARNLGQFARSRDTVYGQMVEEYKRFERLHDKVNYHLAVLDENNILLSRKYGKEYIPLSERKTQNDLVEEVARGIDEPGETDYFTDQIKAKEVLADFNQEHWNELSLEERKQSVNQLADYTASILGVKDRPAIRYYNKEDETDFGGYSARRNEICINEYNMYDAAETADTITHEYRHKYQHERAEQLENERDFEFKEGFENYISPEDDYEAYRNQLVEKDARDFADAVKDKIDEFSNKFQQQIDEVGMHNNTIGRAELSRRIIGRDISYKLFSELVRRSECYEYACSKEKFEKLDFDEIEKIVSTMISKSNITW